MSLVATRSRCRSVRFALSVLAAGLAGGVAANARAQGQPVDLFPVSENRRVIEEALDENVDLELIDTELRQALEYLAHTHGVTIIPDEAELTKVGLSLSDSINLVVSDVPLRDAFDLMLETHGLDVLIENNVLRVTTAAKASQHMETHVYRWNSEDFLPAEVVARTIQQTVAQNTWQVSQPSPSVYSGMMGTSMGTLSGMMGEAVGLDVEVDLLPGGNATPATASPTAGYPAIVAVPGGLVITQSQRVHREIAEVLSQLGQVSLHPAAPPAADPFRAPDGPGALPQNFN